MEVRYRWRYIPALSAVENEVLYVPIQRSKCTKQVQNIATYPAARVMGDTCIDANSHAEPQTNYRYPSLPVNHRRARFSSVTENGILVTAKKA
jgi:hypothetical protein